MKPTYRLGQQHANDGKLNAAIWLERQHICFNCDKHLGDRPYKTFFAHILPKGTFGKFRHRKDNILLLCPQCHHNLDFGFSTDMKRWDEIQQIKQKLKTEYYDKKNK